MKILDSGERTTFASGAVRDIQEGKGRCDLLPLDTVGVYLDKSECLAINNYVRTGVTDFLLDAIKIFANYNFPNDRMSPEVQALLEAAIHFEQGASKYGERNWEQGIPISRYIDSAVRHLLKYYAGYVDEPHDRAFTWNLLCASWTHNQFPELRDLPFNDGRDQE